MNKAQDEAKPTLEFILVFLDCPCSLIFFQLSEDILALFSSPGASSLFHVRNINASYYLEPQSSDIHYCPAEYHETVCWDTTPAGSFANASCQFEYLKNFDLEWISNLAQEAFQKGRKILNHFL